MALVTTNVGLHRYVPSHSRRSRRSTSAVWQPNTPLLSSRAEHQLVHQGIAGSIQAPGIHTALVCLASHSQSRHKKLVAMAKQAPVGVALINNDVAQMRQDAAELAVHRQDAAVEHVRVGDQQLRPVPRLPAEGLPSRRRTIGTGTVNNC